jgi:glycosyltransferase involved in cell wall biosynthesis
MSKEKPRVSIGMPVYNGEDYIEEALDSLLPQTSDDFELIISDNASTDKTHKICMAYAAKDKRIHYYRNKKNLGAAYNYNRLFELAVGKYFKWAAHDDKCAPEYIERCVEVLDREPEAIMCYPRTILIDEHGDIIEYHNDGFDLRSPKPYERFRQYFRSSAWCHPVFGLVRTEVLGKTGFIGDFASSDKVLLGEFALQGKCYEVPEHLAYRRIHPHTSTNTHLTDEEMAAWFNPDKKRSVLAPRWKRMLELGKAIKRARLSPYNELRCYIELGLFYLSPGRFVGAGKDLKQVGRVISRTFSRA